LVKKAERNFESSVGSNYTEMELNNMFERLYGDASDRKESRRN